MLNLKPLSKDAIPAAIEKAERYRLLNEPRFAESICQDILEVDPANQSALIILILSITDQFVREIYANEEKARKLLSSLKNEYERIYYSGIILERKGKATIDRGIPEGSFMAYDWLQSAMKLYEQAEKIRPAGNDDAILRWNTCVRLIERYNLKPKKENSTEQFLE